MPSIKTLIADCVTKNFLLDMLSYVFFFVPIRMYKLFIKAKKKLLVCSLYSCTTILVYTFFIFRRQFLLIHIIHGT